MYKFIKEMFGSNSILLPGTYVLYNGEKYVVTAGWSSPPYYNIMSATTSSVEVKTVHRSQLLLTAGIKIKKPKKQKKNVKNND